MPMPLLRWPNLPQKSATKLGENLTQASEEDEKAIQKEKAFHIQRASEYRTALDEAERTYADMTKRCSILTAMANTGHAEGLQLATQIATDMLALLVQPSAALLIVQGKEFDDQDTALAAQTMNVSAIAMLTGKFMGLNWPQLQRLSLSVLFHKLSKEILEAVPTCRQKSSISSISIVLFGRVRLSQRIAQRRYCATSPSREHRRKIQSIDKRSTQQETHKPNAGIVASLCQSEAQVRIGRHRSLYRNDDRVSTWFVPRNERWHYRIGCQN